MIFLLQIQWLQVQRQTVRNNQPANPTFRNIYSETDYTGHATHMNAGKVYHNKQPASATHIETYINTDYKGPSERSTTVSYVKSDDITRAWCC